MLCSPVAPVFVVAVVFLFFMFLDSFAFCHCFHLNLDSFLWWVVFLVWIIFCFLIPSMSLFVSHFISLTSVPFLLSQMLLLINLLFVQYSSLQPNYLSVISWSDTLVFATSLFACVLLVRYRFIFFGLCEF